VHVDVDENGMITKARCIYKIRLTERSYPNQESSQMSTYTFYLERRNRQTSGSRTIQTPHAEQHPGDPSIECADSRLEAAFFLKAASGLSAYSEELPPGTVSALIGHNGVRESIIPTLWSKKTDFRSAVANLG
jgi:hypothetical protein